MDQVLGQIQSVIATIILAIVMWMVKLVSQRLRLSLSVEQEAWIRQKARAAIMQAEETAAKELKQSGLATSAITKLRDASEQLIRKVPGMTEQEANQLIHEELPALGLGSAGPSLGEKTTVPEKTP